MVDVVICDIGIHFGFNWNRLEYDHLLRCQNVPALQSTLFKLNRLIVEQTVAWLFNGVR